jgi:hypothetical protein
MSTRRIEALAAACLQRADGNVQQATEEMVARVQSTPALYRTLMDPLVREACYDKIRAACRQERAVVWRTTQPDQQQTRRSVAALAEATQMTLLDNFHLPGGKVLGDATKSEIEEASRAYLAQSRDEAVKGRWLAMVAKRMAPNFICRQRLTEAALVMLRRRAEQTN